jgi:hypothetical protein
MAVRDCQGVRVKLIKLKTGVILEAAFLGRIDFTAKIAVNRTRQTLVHRIRNFAAIFNGILSRFLLLAPPHSPTPKEFSAIFRNQSCVSSVVILG